MATALGRQPPSPAVRCVVVVAADGDVYFLGGCIGLEGRVRAMYCLHPLSRAEFWPRLSQQEEGRGAISLAVPEFTR